MNSRDLAILISVISAFVMILVICVSCCLWIHICLISFILFRKILVVGRKAKYVDISGQNVLITGANSGIGLSTAKILAGMKGKIFMTCRTRKKFNEASEYIRKKVKDADLEFVKLELSSLSSIEECVNDLKEQGVELDVVIHNAGVMLDLGEKMEDETGLETMFSVNTLGTFYLAQLLVDADVMKQGGRRQSRMVFVNAKSHTFLKSEILEDHNMTDFLRHPIPGGFTLRGFFSLRGKTQMIQNFHQYSVTKMFMLMLAAQLNEKYHERTGICFNSLHPGVIVSNFGVSREGSSGSGIKMCLRRVIGKVILKSCEEGSQCTVHVATSKELNGVSGAYYDNLREAETHEMVRNVDLHQEIWEIVHKLIDDGRVGMD